MKHVRIRIIDSSIGRWLRRNWDELFGRLPEFFQH